MCERIYPSFSLVHNHLSLQNTQVKLARLQPSCSLQFLPWSLQHEDKIRASYPLVHPLLSFAVEKLADLQVRVHDVYT